jgi:hypothetical protein
LVSLRFLIRRAKPSEKIVTGGSVAFVMRAKFTNYQQISGKRTLVSMTILGFLPSSTEAEGQSGCHLFCKISLQPEELNESHSFCSSPSEDGGGSFDHNRDDRA